MSPECDFFNGTGGVKCHRVRAFPVLMEHLDVNAKELGELLPELCLKEGDSQRMADCPAFRQLVSGNNSDFAIRERL